MRFAHLFTKLFCSPLLVLPGTYATFERALLQRMGLPFDPGHRDPHAFRSTRIRMGDKEVEETTSQPKIETPGDRTKRRMQRVLQNYGRVAVISIDGVIDKRISDFEMDCYGGLDLNDIDAAINAVAADPKIQTVVFDLNTPGGSSAGVAETAGRIAKLGQWKKDGGAAKHTIARVELLCASAGMWLASACDTISAAPGATLGSVGVYCALLDQTGWMANEGLKVNLIKAGEFKAMGASFKALEDSERAMIQKAVDAIYAEFKSAVRDGRGDVADAVMQGQCFSAADARQANLCDVVETASLDEFVTALLSK